MIKCLEKSSGMCVFCPYKNTFTPTDCRRTTRRVYRVPCFDVVQWWEAQSSFTSLSFSLPAGHPPFIHYLKSCSISCVGCEAWQHIPVQQKKGVGVYFNELCVWLTSFFALPEPNMKGSERQSQKAWPGTVWGCRNLLRMTRGAQDERFQWKLKH